jgi:hypothetical protein
MLTTVSPMLLSLSSGSVHSEHKVAVSVILPVCVRPYDFHDLACLIPHLLPVHHVAGSPKHDSSRAI